MKVKLPVYSGQYASNELAWVSAFWASGSVADSTEILAHEDITGEWQEITFTAQAVNAEKVAHSGDATCNPITDVPEGYYILLRDGIFKVNEITELAMYKDVKITKLYTDAEIVTRFVVASDVHYGAGLGETERLEKMFSSAKNYAGISEYTGIDGIFFVGDMTNQATVAQYNGFFGKVNGLRGDIPVYYMLGNHEFFQEHDEQTFASVCDQPINFVVDMGGYTCICISPHHDGFSSTAVEFLSTELAKAAQANPDKPIFVFQHQPIFNTLMKSDPWTSSNWQDLDDILKQYPQVIDIAGHTHAPINNPLTVYQKDYTCVATGGLMTTSLEGFDVPSDSTFPFGQYLIIEIDADGVVYIKPYDVMKNSFCPSLATTGENKDTQLMFTVDVSEGKAGYLYANRKDQFDAPTFGDGAELKILETKPTSVKIEVPTANTEDGVYYYTVEIGNRTFKYCANFYDSTKTGNDVIEINRLQSNIKYTVKVTPVDFYGNSGETLSLEFTIR